MAELTPCSCGHGDLSPNFHLHPCPIKTSYMTGITVGRSQGRAEGRAEERERIQELSASGCSDAPFHPAMCRCVPGKEPT